MGHDAILTTVSTFLLNRYTAERRRFIATSCGALLITWTLLQLNRKPKQRQINNIVPTVSGALPVFGHIFQLSIDPLHFIQKCKAKYGYAYVLKVFSQNYCVVTGTLIRDLVSAQQKYVSFEDVPFLLRQNFKLNQINVFSSRIQQAFKEVLDEELNIKPGEKRQIEPSDFFGHAIARISCLCFAGNRVGISKEMVHAMATFTDSVCKAGAMLRLLPDCIADTVVRRYFSVEREVDIMMDHLVPVLEGIRSGEIPDDETTFISLALKLPKADGSLRSPREAAFHFKEVALGSIHTSTLYIIFALHELACRSELQKELHDEISKLDTCTPDTVNKIVLLDSFLREVLRYNTSNILQHYLAVQDFVLSTGLVVPKGTMVVTAAEDASRDPELTSPSEKSLYDFDAYRFINETESKTSTTAGLDLLNYGLGHHNCPGRYFAAVEIKYVLAELLMRFKISTPSDKRLPDRYVMGMLKRPPKGDIIFEAY